VFQRQAENCAKYLSKGSLVYVEGSLQTRKWQDQLGQDRYTTEVKATRIQFLDRKGSQTENSIGVVGSDNDGRPSKVADSNGKQQQHDDRYADFDDVFKKQDKQNVNHVLNKASDMDILPWDDVPNTQPSELDKCPVN